MPAQAPRTFIIDSLEFAGTGQFLRGELPVAWLSRLRDLLRDPGGEIEFTARGLRDDRERPALTVAVNGTLHLTCQRCLEGLDYPVRIETTLLLGTAPVAAGMDPEEADWVEPSPQFDLAGLVEDEIILDLPHSPRHPEGKCRAAREAGAESAARGQFAGLAVLKRNTN